MSSQGSARNWQPVPYIIIILITDALKIRTFHFHSFPELLIGYSRHNLDSVIQSSNERRMSPYWFKTILIGRETKTDLELISFIHILIQSRTWICFKNLTCSGLFVAESCLKFRFVLIQMACEVWTWASTPLECQNRTLLACSLFLFDSVHVEHIFHQDFSLLSEIYLGINMIFFMPLKTWDCASRIHLQIKIFKLTSSKRGGKYVIRR